MNELRLAQVFSDNMILQRGKPIRLFGMAPNNAQVTASLNGVVATEVASQGTWSIILPSMEAMASCELTVTCEGNKIVIHNVAIGEVWIAGGQSNMEFPLKFDSDAIKMLPDYENPNIRFYDCPNITYLGEELVEDFSHSGVWKLCTPQTASDFSAVGFYFAKKLFDRYHVPVGVISCNMGGTSASTWLDEKYLAEDEQLKVYIDEYENALKTLDLEEYEKTYQEIKDIYREPHFGLVINSLFATTFYTKQQMQAAYIESVKKALGDLVGPKYINRPAGLYHTMVKPIVGYAVKGVIWYQGETDENKASLYGKLFSAVIRCWREAWQDNIPFLYVQLAPFDVWLKDTGVNYPIVREQQEMVSKNIDDAYMISIMDQGMAYDIHPKQKKPIGERLALMAQGKVYKEDILCEPPEVESAEREVGKIVISFKYAGDGLVMQGDKVSGLQVFADNREILNFDAFIQNNRLYIYCMVCSVAKTIEVRYVWKGYIKANIFNSAGLPAKPFKIVI